MIRRYQLENGILLEEQENQIVLKAKKMEEKLSWEETARQMAAEGERWEEWDATAADGLESCPWEHPVPREALAWLAKSTLSNSKRKKHSRQAKLYAQE